MGTLNPYREFVAGISPTEFEVLCLEILKNYAEAEHLSDFSIQHNHAVGRRKAEKIIFLDIRAFLDYNERHSGCVLR